MKKIVRQNAILCLLLGLAVVAHTALFFTLSSLAEEHPSALHAEFPIIGGGDDGIDYVTLGDHMLRFGTFSLFEGDDARPEAYRVPGYPAFLAGIKYLTGTFDATPFFHIVLLILSAVLVYRIVLSVSPTYRTIALVTTGLFLFDPMLFFSTEFIATESLYTFFFLSFLYLLLRQTSYSLVSYASAGAILGISAYVRPAGLMMLIPTSLWLLWRFVRGREERLTLVKQGALLLCTFVLVISPWVIRNGHNTGVYAFSSLDTYNMIEFNIPLFLTYAYNYSVSIEDIRTTIHERLGGMTKYELQELENAHEIRLAEWEILKPHLGSYLVFHVGKTANFFFNPGTKFMHSFFEGFFEGQPVGSWHPQTSFVNSVLDGRVGDVLLWLRYNVSYLPELLFLALMFVCGLVWYSRMIPRSDAAVLIFLMVFFLALLTSPITNARYRIPVIPLIDLAGVAGASLLIRFMMQRSESPHHPR